MNAVHTCVRLCREDHNNTGRLFAAGISWESQQPTTSQNNPALSTVNDTGQQVLMTSENPAYAAVDKRSQQPISQSSHAYVNVDKSVATLEIVKQRIKNF